MRYTFGLCSGRHDIPVEKYLFDTISDPTDFDSMYKQAVAAIPADCTELAVYVTGLTAAMLAVVRACNDLNISLVAYHYDRDNGVYVEQTVINTSPSCQFCVAPTRVFLCCPHCGAT